MKAARKPIKTLFGWIKCVAGQRETKFRGRRRANLFSCNIKKLTKIGPPSLCENSLRERFCSVDLQADIVDASTYPPEGGHYKDQARALRGELRFCARRDEFEE